jgi:hypothetical protein
MIQKNGNLQSLEATMLSTLAVVFVVLWLLGFVSSYTMGGFIHILLVLAIVVVLIRVIQGRRVIS